MSDLRERPSLSYPKREGGTEMSVVENAKEQLLSSGSWSVDAAHSTVKFRVKHMVIQPVTAVRVG